MFDQFKDIGKLMRNAGAIREKAEQFKEELGGYTVEGEAGGGAVRVTLNGRGQAVKVELDQNLLAGIAGDDKVVAEELIAAAINNGMEKVQELVAEQMQKAAGGMDLSSLSGLFGAPPPPGPADEPNEPRDTDEPPGPYKL